MEYLCSKVTLLIYISSLVTATDIAKYNVPIMLSDWRIQDGGANKMSGVLAGATGVSSNSPPLSVIGAVL